MLRNIWTAGLLLFAAVMASTFFITKVWQVSRNEGLGLTVGHNCDRYCRDMLGHRMLGVSFGHL